MSSNSFIFMFRDFLMYLIHFIFFNTSKHNLFVKGTKTLNFLFNILNLILNIKIVILKNQQKTFFIHKPKQQNIVILISFLKYIY
jgi:hypothetical protein